jgi:hypothetical protein
MTPARDRLARTLMIVLGIATLGAFANAAFEFAAVAPERVAIEAWRMFAFPVFAGLFILLGAFPRRMPGLWELVIFQKAAVPIFLIYFVKAAAGTSLTDAGIIPVDTLLTVTTIFCYLLTQGWRAWLSPR